MGRTFELLLKYAPFIQMVVLLFIFIAGLNLSGQLAQYCLNSFISLHQYLSEKDFRDARWIVRDELSKKDYSCWTKEDKMTANSVSSSYDQASIMLSANILDNKTKQIFLKSSWGESICHQYHALAPFLDDKRTPSGKSGRQFFRHFGDLYEEASVYPCPDVNHRVKMSRYKIVSGGQTGVDRAALDVAKELSADYGGWCPKGGWAEDHVTSPGLLGDYPKLQETPLADVGQRTEWNVRDSDATLILISGADLAQSKGTKFTKEVAEKLCRKHLILDLKNRDSSLHRARLWLKELGDIQVLNIAGPRLSEAPDIYKETKAFLKELFE
jgi:Circularly permutated YpsA SLOG family